MFLFHLHEITHFPPDNGYAWVFCMKFQRHDNKASQPDINIPSLSTSYLLPTYSLKEIKDKLNS